MIEIRNVSKSFDGRKVLNDISTIFESGKTNLIIGRSGSGKTVLMKSMVGLVTIDFGDILFNNRSFSNLDSSKINDIRKDIGMLFQGSALFDSMNITDNILFPLQMFSKKSHAEMLKRVEFCLDRVNLKNVGKLFPSEISGGMKKRVAIARAIANNPKYLFCDEPNSGLDPQTSNLIDQLIHEITKEYDITTIVNTHDMNSVIEMGEKIIFINEGSLWWEGSNETLMRSTNPELNDFIFCTELAKAYKERELAKISLP